MHCPPPPIFLEHETGLFYEWKMNEFMNEWMSFPKKPLGQRAVGYQKGGGFFFSLSDSLISFEVPLRKAKAQCSPGLPSLWSPSQTIAPSCPTTTCIQLIQNCCWPREKRGNAAPVITPRPERLWRAHTCTAPRSTEGAMEKGKPGWSGSTEHEPPGIFTTVGLRMASEPKEDLV